MTRTAFLHLGHDPRDLFHPECVRLRRAAGKHAEAWILFHQKRPGAGVPAGSSGESVYVVAADFLDRIGFIPFRGDIIPGCAHFPLLDFFRSHPAYDYYWIVEYDVHFRGPWSNLFRYFRDHASDFLSSHIRRHHEEPSWTWWTLEHPLASIPLGDRIRSFNPIYRISRRALEYVAACHREGWRGHFEVLIPTLLYHEGFRLQDFGGSGTFVDRRDLNRFYLDAPEDPSGALMEGTLRYRPPHKKKGWRWNKLYHPVKAPSLCIDAFPANIQAEYKHNNNSR